MLSLFGLGSRNNVRCGAVLDVGSGSVAAAIVLSRAEERHPQIIWSHREYLPETSDGLDTEKRLRRAVPEVLLKLEADGVKLLRERHPGSSPSLIQVSISAPSAYTIGRSIGTRADKPFRVTGRLVRELENKAVNEAGKHAALLSKKMDLKLLANSTVSLSANGYPSRPPYRGSIKEVSLCQLVSLAPAGLVAEIEAARDKVLPKAVLDFDSFMSLYFRAMADTVPSLADACLVSVTAEATEMLTVRDGNPLTADFVPAGQYSLGREIGRASGLPFTEALSLMRDNGVDNLRLLSDDKKSLIKRVVDSYEERLVGLFRNAGDALAIPNTIYFHTDRLSEAFFAGRLKQAAAKATGLQHQVRPITSEFFSFDSRMDSGILCSAYVFHRKLYEDGELG